MNLNKEITNSYGLWQSKSLVFSPENYDEVRECLEFAVKNNFNVALKGSAMSFSSVCLAKEDEVLIDLSKLDKILDISDERILVQGGAKVFNILKQLLINNKIIGALSGSIHNTVAGNIGSDINGKDSWHFGNFSSNVLSMKIMTASGEMTTVSRNQNQDLFYSIAGGLGLIGIILEVELKIQNIPSANVLVHEKKVSDIDQLINAFMRSDIQTGHFIYAWLNPFAKGKNEGQGIIYTAHFTEGKSLKNEDIEKYAVNLDKHKIFGIKKSNFWTLMRTFYTSNIHKWASNAKYFFQKNEKKSKLSFFDFQYPMVRHLPDWNLYFHPYGFTELHILFPIQNFKSSFHEIMQLCRAYDIQPFTLAVRRHKNCEGYLSFGNDGLSFTLNYSRAPVYSEKNSLFEQLIKDYCIKNNGQLYLSKYPYLSKVEIQNMFPEFEKFVESKQKYDTHKLFSSHAINSDIFN